MGDEYNKKDRATLSRKKNETMMTSDTPEVSDLISQRLRKFYNTVADQPVPDRFMELLNKLEAASAPKKLN